MRSRVKTATAILLIAAAASAAYFNSLRVPFIFDDGPSTAGNASIRNLVQLGRVLAPPAGTTVSGRPVANLSFAVNYALGGTDVRGYHATNLLIHVLAGAALFGIARRTLRRPGLNALFGRDADLLAFAVALIWTLHPLQTESVTYVVQRVESLMGLFYLLTLYCFIRSVASARPGLWQAGLVVACLLGMATKEVMATAPLMVLLYDRTFVAGTFRRALSERRGLYGVLAATWVLPAALLAGHGWSRPGSAGFTNIVPLPAYWLTQCEAVGRYLGLSFWPHPLVFDYGSYLVSGWGEVAPYAVVVVACVVATLVALRRWPAVGFLGAWFFVILAPTSMVPVATQTMAEHRIYLPLAAVVSLVAVGAYAWAGRRALVPLIVLALGLGVLTAERNSVYQSAVSLWTDTVTKRPSNARAHCSLGQALASIPDAVPGAIVEFEEALRLHPDYADAHTDLGLVLEDVPGRLEDAIGHLAEAVRLRPDVAQNHNNLGSALAKADRAEDAAGEFRTAVDMKPDFFEARANLGILLCDSGALAAGMEQLEMALGENPTYARAEFYLANALVRTGRIPSAIEHYEGALRDEPTFAEASNNLGMVLCRIGRSDEGLARIDAAIRMQPNLVQAHFTRGAALMQAGRRDEAAAEYQRVLQLRPNDPSALRMLQLISTAR